MHALDCFATLAMTGELIAVLLLAMTCIHWIATIFLRKSRNDVIIDTRVKHEYDSVVVDTVRFSSSG